MPPHDEVNLGKVLRCLGQHYTNEQVHWLACQVARPHVALDVELMGREDREALGPVACELPEGHVTTCNNWISFGDFANMMTGPESEVQGLVRELWITLTLTLTLWRCRVWSASWRCSSDSSSSCLMTMAVGRLL